MGEQFLQDPEIGRTVHQTVYLLVVGFETSPTLLIVRTAKTGRGPAAVDVSIYLIAGKGACGVS